MKNHGKCNCIIVGLDSADANDLIHFYLQRVQIHFFSFLFFHLLRNLKRVHTARTIRLWQSKEWIAIKLAD